MTLESQATRNLRATVKMARGLHLRTVDVPLYTLVDVLAELEQLHAGGTDRDESRYYQFATEDPDGLRRAADDEAAARQRARTSRRDHSVALAVLRREIRQRVGHWEPVDDRT